MGVIWVYGVIWVNFIFRFQSDRKLRISIRDFMGVEIYTYRSCLSGVEELFDDF